MWGSYGLIFDMKQLILPLFVLASFASHAAETFVPEASAACRQGKSVVVASDEDKNHLWIMNGESSLQKTEVKNFSWDDMEGLAPFEGEDFFGITSHSLTKKGKRKPEREQFIAFRMKNGQIEKFKTWSLRDELMDLITAKIGKDVDLVRMKTAIPDEGGLNVEGLGYFDQKFYLGLRSPLTKNGEAIIVTLGHPETNPQLLEVIKLDLKGSGIRGIDQDARGLVILSGPSGDKRSAFGLFHLNPITGSLTEQRYAGFDQIKRPESVVKFDDGSLLLVQDFEDQTTGDVFVRLRP
jgi:hypothetical protein